MNRRLLLLTSAVAAFLLAAMLMPRAPTIAQPNSPRRAETSNRPLQGSASCSASACHGGVAIGQSLSEAATWRSLDPHARAYDTLLTSESAAIARKLWGAKKQAHDAPLCLKCHVGPGYENARPNFRKQDGVGCESCHGSASDWLAPHYRAAWKTTPAAEKLARGFADTKSLAGRAAICATCHVGTPDANVDHDLIAAGHPPLRFEFATYFANLPPHWDVAKDKKTNSTEPGKHIDFELRTWTVGQLVTSAHAFDLLAHRAEKSWPEYAEMDCSSCHHDLQSPSWRQNAKHLKARRPGSFVRADWYSAMVPDALAALNAGDGKVDELLKGLQGGFDDDAKSAKALSASLRILAGKPAPDRLDARIAREGLLKNRLDQSWDAATQRYLALLAIRQAAKDANQTAIADLDRAIQSLRDEVTFPPGVNSPRGFAPPALRLPK